MILRKLIICNRSINHLNLLKFNPKKHPKSIEKDPKSINLPFIEFSTFPHLITKQAPIRYYSLVNIIYIIGTNKELKITSI